MQGATFPTTYTQIINIILLTHILENGSTISICHVLNLRVQKCGTSNFSRLSEKRNISV
jgi:hypothetical protein